jgi:transposase-like protein
MDRLMDDLKTFCCQKLACRTCQHRFSERKGTALYRCKLPEEKALSVLRHLQESCGVRQTSRLVGVNKNTVVRLAVVAGEQAKDVHAEVVASSPQDP